MIDRRQMFFLGGSLLLARPGFAGGCEGNAFSPAPKALMRPGEWLPHSATWMAFGATIRAWGDSQDTAFDRDLSNSRTVARQDLMRLAATISRFEPVFMLVSDAADQAEAEGMLAAVMAGEGTKNEISSKLDQSGRIYIGADRTAADLPAIGSHPISFLVGPMDDLWTRDTAPMFVISAEEGLRGVNVNFNGWGQWPISTGLCGWKKDPDKTANGVLDQFVEGDRQTAAFINAHLGVPEVGTWATLEGGGLEANGTGLGMAMASSIVNPNRNPGKSEHDLEIEFKRLFGIERMLWMPGVMGEELTDWHVDFTARFAGSARIVHAFDRNWEPEDNRNELALLAGVAAVNSLPSEDRAKLLGGADELTLHSLPVPQIEEVYRAYASRNREFPITERSLEEFILTTAPGYVGFYYMNGAVVMGQFGDVEADLAAYDMVQTLHPDRIVIQITTDGLASGGGTIHCATQEQPSV